MKRTRQDLVTVKIAQMSAIRLFREHGLGALSMADERLRAARDADEVDEIEVWKAILKELDHLMRKARC